MKKYNMMMLFNKDLKRFSMGYWKVFWEIIIIIYSVYNDSIYKSWEKDIENMKIKKWLIKKYWFF